MVNEARADARPTRVLKVARSGVGNWDSWGYVNFSLEMGFMAPVPLT